MLRSSTAPNTARTVESDSRMLNATWCSPSYPREWPRGKYVPHATSKILLRTTNNRLFKD